MKLRHQVLNFPMRYFSMYSYMSMKTSFLSAIRIISGFTIFEGTLNMQFVQGFCWAHKLLLKISVFLLSNSKSFKDFEHSTWSQTIFSCNFSLPLLRFFSLFSSRNCCKYLMFWQVLQQMEFEVFPIISNQVIWGIFLSFIGKMVKILFC